MNLFDVRRDEARPVALALLLSFAIGVPRVFTLAAANDLFMAEHGPAMLPWAYVAGAVGLALLSVVYVRISRRVAPRRLGLAVLFGLAVLSAAAYVGLSWIGPRWISFALIIGVEAEITLTGLTFWGLVSRVFTLPQARRLFGLVSAGEVVPTLVGGLALPGLVAEIGVWNLLLVSVAGHAAAALALVVVEDAAGAGEVEAEAPAKQGTGAESAQRRYMLWIGAIVAINVFVYYAVDNAFFHATQEANLGEGRLAAFLGDFFVALGLVSLCFKLFLSGRWRRWLGLQSALLSVPLTLLVLASVALFAHGPLYTMQGALLAVVLLKLWERVTIEAIHVPSVQTLLLPLPGETRAAARATLDGVVVHSAALVAGGVLLLLNQRLTAEGLTTAVVVALVLWAGVGVKVAASYRDVLRTALAERRLDPSGLRDADATTLRLLTEGLDHPDPSRVLWNLHLLRELGHPQIESLAQGLLDHEASIVVEAAARLLEREGTDKSAPVVLRRLERADGEPKVKARLLRALSQLAPDHALDRLRAALDDDAPEVVAAAAVGLHRHGGPEARRHATPRLTALSRDANPRARQLAARAVGSISEAGQARLLTRLVRDPDLEVQRAALRAAGRIQADELWPFVVDALAPRRLRDVAADALVRGDAKALPYVLEAARRPGQYWRIRHRLVEIAARIGGPEAVAAAVDIAVRQGETDLDLRRAVLRALERSHARLASEDRKRLEATVDAELDRQTFLRSVQARLDVGEAADLVRDAVRQERAKSRDRILLALALALDSAGLREARTVGEEATREARDLAFELLEQSLPRAYAERVIAALSPPETSAAPADGPLFAELLGFARQGGLRWLGAVATEAAATAGATVDTQDIGQSAESLSRVRTLASEGLLERLGGEALADLAQRARARRLAPGETLTTAGDEVRSLLMLRDGMISAGTDGRRPALYTPPYRTNALALLRPLPAPSTLTAESEVDLLEVRAELLQDLFDDDLDAAWALLQAVCDELRRRSPDAPASAELPARPARPRGRTALPERSYYEILQRLLGLRATPPFRAVEEHVLFALAEAVDEVVFRADEPIVREGALGTSMYILLEGEVRVDRGPHEIARIAAPDVFGEMSAIAPAPRSATVTAVGPTRALVLSRETLRDVAFAQHDVLRVMLDLLLDRMKLGRDAKAPRAAPRPTFVTDDMTL